ncbi:MAG: RNA polymerase sigma factor [Ignavibacteriales bacterium]|nr:RNA polymerase sigma factor [Ignavibacteriales bacterium]
MKDKKELILILRAQSGDKEALNSLLKTIQSQLYWYIYNMLSDKTHAKDILQEVFVIIYKKLPMLKQPEFFRSWVYRLATREIFCFIRKNSSYKELATENEQLENHSFFESENKIEEVILEKLSSLVNSLSPASRSVITLHYNGGMSINEVADILNISVGTAKSRLAYGLQILREKAKQDKILLETIGT